MFITQYYQLCKLFQLHHIQKKKAKIITNVLIEPDIANGLTKLSIADCLQTRPIDYTERMVKIRGEIDNNSMLQIDTALKIVFEL